MLKSNIKYNLLTTVEKSHKQGNFWMWLCKCECGKLKYVRSSHLTSNAIKSCGCLMKNGNHKSHNQSGTKLYKVWASMKQRCLNRESTYYKDYGGRGITVCDKWLRFEGFYEDMSQGYKSSLKIERVDNNGSYCKKNCEWATLTTQARNRRNNRYIEYKGRRKTVAEWANIFRINDKTIYWRLQHGWDINRIFT